MPQNSKLTSTNPLQIFHRPRFVPAPTKFTIPDLDTLILDESGQPARNSAGELYISKATHALQMQNQVTLWNFLMGTGLTIPKGPIMDIGCGDGGFETIAPVMVFPVIDRRVVYGLDLDRKKIKTAREISKLITAHYAKPTPQNPHGRSLVYTILDPQDLAVTSKFDVDGVKIQNFPYNVIVEGRNHGQFPQMALVWSNSMFHWIKEPEKKYDALMNINKVLKSGGLLCMSLSAGGTARDFLRAYRSVFFELGPFDTVSNRDGYRQAHFEEDPIGSRPLNEIINMMEDSGFDVKNFAQTKIELASYSHPREYATHVEVYGRDNFLRSVAHYGENRKRALWSKIVDQFLEVLKKKGWKEGKPYEYYQYNNYIVAVKRSEADSVVDKKFTMRPESVLNELFMTHSYGRLLNVKGSNIKISLRGDKESLSDEQTNVNIDGVLREVFSYAAQQWPATDTERVCHLSYIVAGKTLVLGLEIKTSQPKGLEEILKPKTLTPLTEAGASMQYDTPNGNRVIYTLQIPLLS